MNIVSRVERIVMVLLNIVSSIPFIFAYSIVYRFDDDQQHNYAVYVIYIVLCCIMFCLAHL